jgi:hypothetical protein
MKVFIPLSDDPLERWPDDEALVPYRPGLKLLSQLDAPAATATESNVSRGEAAARPRDERPARLLCRS